MKKSKADVRGEHRSMSERPRDSSSVIGRVVVAGSVKMLHLRCVVALFRKKKFNNLIERIMIIKE